MQKSLFVMLGLVTVPLLAASAHAGQLMNLSGVKYATPTGGPTGMTDVTSTRIGTSGLGSFTSSSTSLAYTGATLDGSNPMTGGVSNSTTFAAGYQYAVNVSWNNTTGVATGTLNVMGADKELNPAVVKTYTSSNLLAADVSTANTWKFIFTTSNPQVDYLVLLFKSGSGVTQRITADVDATTPPSIPLPTSAAMGVSTLSLVALRRRRQ